MKPKKLFKSIIYILLSLLVLIISIVLFIDKTLPTQIVFLSGYLAIISTSILTYNLTKIYYIDK